MKPQILFIQGGGAGAHNVDGHLVADLRRCLGSAYEVRYPAMPREEEPDYHRWKPEIEKELSALPDRSVLVGHSLGASFHLKYLAENRTGKLLRGIFLIATPYWGGKGWRYEGWEQVALPDDFATKLPPKTPLFLYHGRDDATVPFAHLALYADKLLHATVRALDRRDHQLNSRLSDVAFDIAHF